MFLFVFICFHTLESTPTENPDEVKTLILYCISMFKKQNKTKQKEHIPDSELK